MPRHGSSYFPSKAPSSYTAAAWLKELLFSKHRWMLIRVVTQAVLKGTEVPSFWGNVRPHGLWEATKKCFHPGKKADLEQGARCGKADCRQEGRFRQWNGEKAGLCHRDAAVGQTRSSRASHGSQPPRQTDWHACFWQETGLVRHHGLDSYPWGLRSVEKRAEPAGPAQRQAARAPTPRAGSPSTAPTKWRIRASFHRGSSRASPTGNGQLDGQASQHSCRPALDSELKA